MFPPSSPFPTPLRATHSPSTDRRGGSWHQRTALPEEGWLETWEMASEGSGWGPEDKCGGHRSLAKGPASWGVLRAHLPAGLTRPGVLEEL